MRPPALPLAALVCLLLPAAPAFGQAANFEDGFEDGEFTSAPAWTGHHQRFTVSPFAYGHLLQLESPDTEEAWLSTPSGEVTGYWEFFVMLDGFLPSGSNRAEIFLMSDREDLSGAVSGYAVQVGQTGDDFFRLVRYDAGDDTDLLADTTRVTGAAEGYRVRVDRSAAGEWSLQVARGYLGEPVGAGSTVTDLTYATATYFGVRVQYTSTRSDRFHFDFKIDRPPFRWNGLRVTDDGLRLAFGREVDGTSVQASDFHLTPDPGVVPSITQPAPDTLLLDYGGLPSAAYELSAEAIAASDGEEIEPDTVAFLVFGQAAPGELLISEFAYDPPEGAPEYVELVNTGPSILNLEDWRVADATGSAPLAADTLALFPGSLLALTSDTAALSDAYTMHGPLASVPSLPVLNNAGDLLLLLAPGGWTSDSLAYSPSWGGADGALERRSLEVEAAWAENWGEAPGDPGGSPGLSNGVAADREAPRMRSLRFTGDHTMELVFSERLATASAGDRGRYAFSGEVEVGDVAFAAPDTVRLSHAPALANNTTYTFSVEGVEDLFGNASAPWDTTFTWQEISTAGEGDLLITEFLYDPPPGWTEFVEIYNPGAKSFSAEELFLEDAGGIPVPLSTTPRVIPPRSRWLLVPDATLADSLSGVNVLVLGSAFPALNNGGDRILLRTAGGTAADSLQYEPSWGGRQRALERRSLSRPAPAAYNWSEPPDGSTGTPGAPNLSRPDETAPRLLELNVAAGNRLELLFSEEVDSTGVRPNRFRLQPGVPVSAARLTGPASIALALEGGLRHRQRYTLSFEGIADAWGNAAQGSASFTHLDYPGPDRGELLITEFMYDPPPGWSEYVEIYNAGEEDLSLRGITLSDAGGRRAALADSLVLLAPGGWLVLAPDATLRDSFPDMNLLEMGSRFPALNNGGDRIVLGDSAGGVLEELAYTGDWSGREQALERRSLEHPASLRENWVSSPQGRGSPGKANRARPDREPPELLALAIPDDRTFSLLFSESLQEASLHAGRVSISPAEPLQAIELYGDSLVLRTAGPLQSGTTYTVTVEKAEDVFGNAMARESLSARYLRIDPAVAGDLVMNEILFREDENTGEFIEVLNVSPKNLDLEGWRIGDAVSSASLREPVILLPGELLVLTGTGTSGLPDHGPAQEVRYLHVPGFPSLNNRSDRVYLRSAGNVTVDSLAYDAESHPVRAGYSLERRDPLAPTLDPANWTESRAEGGASAGQPNSAFRPDVEPPRVLFAGVNREGFLEVRFGEFVRLLPETEFTAGRQMLRVVEHHPHHADRLLLEPEEGGALAPGASASALTIRDLEDYRGNRLSHHQLDIAWPPGPGDLSFNEIMYEPIASADDGRPDQAEYVEVVNRRDYALSLEGLYLHGAADENGRVTRLMPDEDRHRRIAGGGMALLYADTAAVLGRSRVGVYFRMKADGDSLAPPLLRFHRDALGLSPDRPLYLADSSGTTIDSLFYSSGWHNPDLVDVRGIALEKIDPSLTGGASFNWGSSADPLGGTPLEENSIRIRMGDAPVETGLRLTPNPFSPDGDGHEDHLVVSWVLDRPDYLMRVRIYDRYGRLVHTLADGMRAGLSGSLLWDGRDGHRRSNRIGIYIVTLEAWSDAAGRRKAYRELAVLARTLR